MANTTSFAFPDMISVTQNKVNLLSDTASVANRVKLLMLTEPTELYNEPDFGVGLKRYIGRYNNDNVKAEITERTKSQVGIHEPSVDPATIEWSRGLEVTGHNLTRPQNVDGDCDMTMKMTTNFKTTFTIDVENGTIVME